MRLPRPRIKNCCVHVTQRCHKREYLLGYDLDRQVYRKRLFQATRGFPAIRVLDYVITSNHVHLLVYAPRMRDLSVFMKWLQGTAAGDINRRQKREGAFWSSSLAVGSRQWIEGLVGDDSKVQQGIVPVDFGDGSACKLKVTQSVYQHLMKRWQNMK